MFLIEKWPTEKRRREFEFDNEIASDDSLASATYTVVDEDGTVVTNDLVLSGSKTITDNSVLLTIIGGTAGRLYLLAIEGTTANGFLKKTGAAIRVLDYQG
jgi:hypothetical protein